MSISRSTSTVFLNDFSASLLTLLPSYKIQRSEFQFSKLPIVPSPTLKKGMKIQCDVCGKDAAAVFCTADEAALCQNCDNRVHNANKLASKHPRFSLLNPQIKESPRCDICQKRQALLFCQEDRALLCRECDTPIHTANELTKKHNRFLLTGVKLSPDASSYQAATSSSGSQSAGEQASDSTSSISEYLMETLPGWHVEDLLDPSSHYGF